MRSLDFSRFALLALGLSLMALTGCGEKAAALAAGGPDGRGALARAPQVVEVTAIQRRDMAETLNLVGTLAANESAEVRPEIGGIVRQIFFAEGRTVKQGEVMLQIDDAELRAQLAQVEARFELARLNVERSSNLSETRTIPQSEFDRARSEFAAAQAELSLLKLRLEKTQIKAPFDGLAGSRTISPGDFITPTTVITTVNDLSALKISFQVPERFLAKVRPGSAVSATVRSETRDTQEVIGGGIYFVSSTIERASRAFEVKALLANPSAALRPGMFANVTLVLEVREQVLMVPEGAILADGRGVQIITVGQKDGQPVAEFVLVRTGLRVRGMVEVSPVRGEIAPDTEVVASGVGALMLFPGAPLAPKPLREQFRVSS